MTAVAIMAINTYRYRHQIHIIKPIRARKGICLKQELEYDLQSKPISAESEKQLAYYAQIKLRIYLT